MKAYSKLPDFYSSSHLVYNGIMKCIQLIKSVTSIRLFEEFPYIRKQYLWCDKFWSRSSFIATVGSVSLETVKKIHRESRKIIYKILI